MRKKKQTFTLEADNRMRDCRLSIATRHGLWIAAYYDIIRACNNRIASLNALEPIQIPPTINSVMNGFPYINLQTKKRKRK